MEHIVFSGADWELYLIVPIMQLSEKTTIWIYTNLILPNKFFTLLWLNSARVVKNPPRIPLEEWYWKWPKGMQTQAALLLWQLILFVDVFLSYGTFGLHVNVSRWPQLY